MKTKSLLTTMLILTGLVAAIVGAYAFARFILDPTLPTAPGIPLLSRLNLPPQTQNGFKATLESYYADAARLAFRVRISGGNVAVATSYLTDMNGNNISGTAGISPVNRDDPSVYLIEFNPVSLLGERFKGKLEFGIAPSLGSSEYLARFSFDLDLPVRPALTFEPKQSYTSASGINILLDRIVITPSYTQVYLCYVKPSEADWNVSNQTAMEIGGQTANLNSYILNSYTLLFDSSFGEGIKIGEPGWKPPVQDGRCVKLGFPIGDADPQSMTLSVPALEQSMPEVIPADKLADALNYLKASRDIDMEWRVLDRGSYPVYKKLPPGMTEQQAYREFIGALGYIYNGQWEFDVQLKSGGDSVPKFSTSSYGAATPIPFPTDKPRVIATLPGRINSFGISPDSETIAIATSKGVVLYDLASEKQVRTLSETENVYNAAWSPDGKKLAVGSVIMESADGGRLHLAVWDTSAWKIIFEPQMTTDTFASYYGAIAWSSDGNFLAVNDYANSLVVFDIKTGKITSTQKDFILPSNGISWSPDGSRIVATGDLGYGIRRWRLDTGESVWLYDQRGDAATQVVWMPDGKRIVSGYQNGIVCFWTAATNQCDGFIKAHDYLYGLALTSDGRQLATSGNSIRIWDTATGKMIRAFGGEINDSSFLSRYTQLAWPAPDLPLISLEERYRMGNDAGKVIRFWDVNSGRILFEFQGTNSASGQ